METTTANETVREHIEQAHSDSAFTRQRRFADAGRCMATLEIVREDLNRSYTGHCRLTGKVIVSWNANRGRGWLKGWKAKFDSEAAALAFADEKWPVLLAWVAKEAANG